MEKTLGCIARDAWVARATHGSWQAVADAVVAAHEAQAHTADLRAALEKIVEMNRQHASDEYGDPDKAEQWSCVLVARAALAIAAVESAEVKP